MFGKIIIKTLKRSGKYNMYIKDEGIKKWNQEVHFDNGSVRTINNIIKAGQGNWFHVWTEDKKEFIFNPDKILFVKLEES